MRKTKWVTGLFAAAFLAAAIPFCSHAETLTESQGKELLTKENIVVMLDPGHGGNALGGQVPGVNEKDINLITAYSIKAELEKYDGITVLMTRYADTALSLAQRAAAAAEQQADFLFSIHYNKSEYSQLFGAEVWIPSIGEGYSKGYACGDLILNELCDGYGLCRRGVKTKLNTRGTDYYGIIRESAALGIPAVIIEHCHMDHAEDVPYFNSMEKLQELGRRSATGIAKYFGLKSALLGVDYSALQKTELAAPFVPVMQDVTPPEEAKILSAKKEGGKIHVRLLGKDAQSPILYYSYSLDGEKTWSPLQKWQSIQSEYETDIPADGTRLTVRIYNQYDLFTQSAPLFVS